MSLLTIAQAVADYTGFERPTSVVGNTDPIARQLLAFINRQGKQLMRANNWPILLKEHTFNTVNGTQSYALPTDFDRSLDGTVYNRTDTDQMTGPITPQQYALDRYGCPLYQSDAADDLTSVDLVGRRSIKKKKRNTIIHTNK